MNKDKFRLRILFGWMVVFNCISTPEGRSMPNPVYSH